MIAISAARKRDERKDSVLGGGGRYQTGGDGGGKEFRLRSGVSDREIMDPSDPDPFSLGLIHPI